MTDRMALFPDSGVELSMVSFFATDGSSPYAASIHVQRHRNPHLIMHDIHVGGGGEVAGKPINVFLELC